MSDFSNRTLLEKAALVMGDLTGGGGLLKPEHAKKFLRLLVKQSVLLKHVIMQPMSAGQQETSALRFSGRVLRPGTEGVALASADHAKPTFSKTALDAHLFKAEVPVSDEVFEDNIERAALRQTLMTALAEAIARDMEEVIIQGDTSSIDPLLAVMDGLVKQAVSQVVDAAGGRLEKALLRDMLKTIPSEHLRNKPKMRFLTSVDADLDYRDALAERPTAIGDKLLLEGTPVLYSGVPILPIPLWPEQMGTSGDKTCVLLTDPKNIVVGVRRKIRFETARDISAGVTKIVATLRMDTGFIDQDAVVKAINVSVQ